MENAVDALKIVLAIFIFSMGLIILFNMSSQARETARILIAETDPTKYYEYIEQEDASDAIIDKNGNKIVEIKDIIPALYKYSEENYGVTIVNKHGEIVARFDLDTERACNSWVNATNESKTRFIEETRRTYEKANSLAKIINNRDETINLEALTLDKIEERIFLKLYEQDTTSSKINRPYYCYWLGSMGWTSQRIDSDLSRNRCTF